MVSLSHMYKFIYRWKYVNQDVNIRRYYDLEFNIPYCLLSY